MTEQQMSGPGQPGRKQDGKDQEHEQGGQQADRQEPQVPERDEGNLDDATMPAKPEGENTASGGSMPSPGRLESEQDRGLAEGEAQRVKRAARMDQALALMRVLRDRADQSEAPPIDMDLVRKYVYGQLDPETKLHVSALVAKYETWCEASIKIRLEEIAEKN
jgi:hypothetical protein